MQITLLKSKLHQASVTSARPDYSGSLSIDQNLMEAAGILHHEKILVGNIANGERFETYCIPADHGSGEIGFENWGAFLGVCEPLTPNIPPQTLEVEGFVLGMRSFYLKENEPG